VRTKVIVINYNVIVINYTFISAVIVIDKLSCNSS